MKKKRTSAQAPAPAQKRGRSNASGKSPAFSGEAPPPPSPSLLIALCLALAVVTLLVYAQTYRHGFIAYDDDQYVYDNPIVQKGWTAAGVSWAFTSFLWGNWHPVTWLSYMTDCELFGVNAGAHHLVNTAFHVANTLLLFLILVKMTARPWRSVIVAAIFALHPLHVESVAWIAERKDVLSAFLGLLALLFYVRYCERASTARYILVALFLALSLMAKPMLVTFPLLVLLLDLWPLKRVSWPPAKGEVQRLLVEKILLFVMVAASSVVAVIAQRSSGAVESLSRLPLPARLANACVATMSYIGRALWPDRLGVLYPMRPVDTGIAFVCLALLLMITYGAMTQARRRPYLPVGWFWYLISLVPVIGIVQIGAQSSADRYTYLPLVGLSIAVVWLIADLVEQNRTLQRAALAAAGFILLALGAQAYRQTAYWKSSQTLFEHTLAVTERNYIIHNNLGVVLAKDGQIPDAVAHYQAALEIYPDYPEANANFGHELLRAGNLNDAYSRLTKAVASLPKSASVRADLGLLFAAQGKFEESKARLEESLQLSPDQASVHSNLAFVLQRTGHPDEAIRQCTEALRIDSNLADAHFNMGMALVDLGRKNEAAAEFTRVLALAPGNAAAQAALKQLESK